MQQQIDDAIHLGGIDAELRRDQTGRTSLFIVKHAFRLEKRVVLC